MTITLNGTTGITTPALTNSGALTQTGAATLSSTLQAATTIGVGGATPAASGAGITFPATQSASSDANTLDDYEEGTFTATFIADTGSNPTCTYTYQTGTYTKIGRLVYYTVRMGLSATSGGTTSLLIIGGFPFTALNNAYNYPGGLVNYKNGWTTQGPDYGRMLAGGTGLELYYDNGTGEGNIQTNYLSSSLSLIVTGCYLASA